MAVIDEVAAERARQISAEGWTTEHDDTDHNAGELARAAISYIAHTHYPNIGYRLDKRQRPHYSRYGDDPPPVFKMDCYVPTTWPWAADWWKPKQPRRNLLRAAALIVAEIERMDRAEHERCIKAAHDGEDNG